LTTSAAQRLSQADSQQKLSFAHTQASIPPSTAHPGAAVTAQQALTHWNTPGLQEGLFGALQSLSSEQAAHFSTPGTQAGRAGSLQSPSALQAGPQTLHPSCSTSAAHSALHCSAQHWGALTQTQFSMGGLEQPGIPGVTSQQSPCLTQTFLVTSQAGLAGSVQ
jgi:hypothetical protein